MVKADWKIGDLVKPDDMNAIGTEINDLQERTSDAESWQKHKLTEDDGLNKILEVNYDLNTLLEAGVYSVPAPLNGPTTADWYYVEVFVHNAMFVMQRATLLSTSDADRVAEVYVRTTSNGASSWGTWKRMTDFDVPDASTSVKGKTQLSSAVDSSLEDRAATPKAVKTAYDEALAAKQLGVETKSDVVAALNSIGVSATTSDSWDSLITKMAGVIRATGNATVAQVLSGATFSNASANGLTGTMVNRGAVSQDITTQNGSYTVPAGYHSGSGIIRAVFANLIASNIREGINVGGILGTLIEGKKFATGVSQTSSSSLIVSGLSFKPSIILYYYNSAFLGYGMGVDTDVFGAKIGLKYASSSMSALSFTTTADGFTASVGMSIGTDPGITWIAIGW